jgi:hypothetical protein
MIFHDFIFRLQTTCAMLSSVRDHMCTPYVFTKTLVDKSMKLQKESLVHVEKMTFLQRRTFIT